MSLGEHPNVLHFASHLELGENGLLERVIVVYTDLQTDTVHPKYDREKMDSLIEAVYEHTRNDPAVMNVDIVHVPPSH